MSLLTIILQAVSEGDHTHEQMGAKRQGRLVAPVQEEGDPSFSKPHPDFRSPLEPLSELDFLKGATCCCDEKIQINNMQQMLLEDTPSAIHSRPFLLKAPHGYKVCTRVMIDQENISIGIMIMKGENDKLLAWPFNKIVVLRLENQGAGCDAVKMFRCDENGSLLKESLERPENDMNLAMGYPQFISRQELIDGDFVKNNAMVLNCYFFPRDAKIDCPECSPSIIK